jgi:radical SAM superfamily enzyme YgiQ (UPF0313 family)
VMVNASFVFGMDEDDEGVFSRTVEWAVANGIETATFHILTPYPGSPLHARMAAEGRLLHSDWDLYDTRHAVFRPKRMTPDALERGYRQAYRDFYSFGSILRSVDTKADLRGAARHLCYTVGWKKLEPLWDWIIAAGRVGALLPVLEAVLSGFKRSQERSVTESTMRPAIARTELSAR